MTLSITHSSKCLIRRLKDWGVLPMGVLVAVYGTLRKGQQLNSHMDVIGAEFLGVCRMPRHRMLKVDGMPYPACYYTNDIDDYVVTEIWETDPEGLDHLDKVEGFYPDRPKDSLYLRHQVAAAGFGRTWIYTFNHKREGRIIHDWTDPHE